MDTASAHQDHGESERLSAAVGVLADFLRRQPLTPARSLLEHRLEGADASSAGRVAEEAYCHAQRGYSQSLGDAIPFPCRLLRGP